jgi:hypothetical protein
MKTIPSLSFLCFLAACGGAADTTSSSCCSRRSDGAHMPLQPLVVDTVDFVIE